MTYFEFLGIFLVLPILALGALAIRTRRRTGAPSPLPYWAIFAHVVIALIYTTPWDNYLVATGVWWYDPELVTGIVFGWVPIEEYTFFVLQPILIGLWLVYWIRRLPEERHPRVPASTAARARWTTFALVALVWAVGTWLLFSGWNPGTYLGLALAWALPPVLLQIGFGGDILRRYWRLVALGILIPTIYLSAADSLAITAGTWTIDPAQSTGLMLGELPVEEILFFFLTSTLLTLGLVLIWAPESKARLTAIRNFFFRRTTDRTQ